MKQFYEIYAASSPCIQLWREREKTENTPNSRFQDLVKEDVSSLLTQLENADQTHVEFVTTLLTQLSWSHHLMIISKTQTPEEKLFYLLMTIAEKLSVRELERHLNSGMFERVLC